MADIIRNQINPDATPFFGVSWTAEDFQIQGNDYFREVLDDLPAAIYTGIPHRQYKPEEIFPKAIMTNAII